MKLIKNLKKSLGFSVAFLSVLLSFSCQMNNLGLAALSTKDVAADLWYLEISGNDGFDEFLNNGGASSDEAMAEFIKKFLSKGPYGQNLTELTINSKDIACSAFITGDGNGGYLAGRNYDWSSNCKAIILKDSPTNGYSSISTVDLDFLGFGDNYKPDNFIYNFMAIAAVYIPLDGINEKGLVVADLMAGDSETTSQETAKKDLTTVSAIRLLLNKAATTDEAVSLLGQYDMHSSIGTAHHLFIADKTGKAVVVEWQSNVMYVSETTILTNHYITGSKKGTGLDNSKDRFLKIEAAIKNAGFTMTNEQVKNTLNSVKAQNYGPGGSTQWSIVYSLSSNPSETLYWRSDFQTPYQYLLAK